MRSRIGAARAGVAAACSRTTVAAAILLIAGAGCYFLKYDKLARTHVDIFLRMTEKMEDLTARDGAAPAALSEYRYPLERAQDFARIAARRFEGRASLQALRELIAAYERMLATAERVRAGGDGAGDAPRAVAEAAAAVRGAAIRVEETLDFERDGAAMAPDHPVHVSTV